MKMLPKCILYYSKYLFQNSIIPTGIHSVSYYLGMPKIHSVFAERLHKLVLLKRRLSENITYTLNFLLCSTKQWHLLNGSESKKATVFTPSHMCSPVLFHYSYMIGNYLKLQLKKKKKKSIVVWASTVLHKS